MPTVREIAQSLREEFLSSNIYRESRQYTASSTPIRPTIADIIITGGYPPGYSQTSDPNETIYTVGRERISSIIRERVASETLDEIIPSSVSIVRALKGLPLVLRADDYRITRKQRVINLIERLTGLNTDIDPFTESDRQLRSSQAVDSKYFEFTGSFQKTLHLNAVKQNYFSIRTAVERDERFRKANRTSTYYLNKRLQGSSKYYSSYVYLDTSIGGVQRSVGAISELTHQSSSGIGSVLAQGFTSDDLAEDGEFGESPRQKLRAGDCVGPTGYNIDTTHDLNYGLDATDPNNEIVWGATTLKQVEDKFKAKRGLLNFNAQILDDRDNSVGQTMDMTKTCYNRRGEIVFKGTPCRSWTYLDYYGKTTDTFIRGYGNQVENSVAKDYVHPKIHPTVDGKGNLDSRNMMFSFENLAYTKQDLIENDIPECEWGPRYGRLLWFPPYIKTYSENTATSYNSDKFIGRGESLYTYSNTERSFSLTFMLIMDYPFWMDKVNPEDMARIFACDFDKDKDKILEVPTFGGSTITPPIEPEPPDPIELPPVDLPSIFEEIGFADGNDLKYYFENDEYGFVANYEFYADPSGNVLPNLFALNSDFYNSDPNDPNPPSLSQIDAAGSDLEVYKKVLSETISNGVDVRDFYDIRFVGNASTLFIGLQTAPAIYNRYLSYRRAFTLAKELLKRYGISPSSMRIDTQETDAVFFQDNPNRKDSTLDDYNPDRMFPPAFSNKSDYIIRKIGINMVFNEVKGNGGRGVTIIVVAEGSSNSTIAVDDANKNTRAAKTQRNVLVSSIVDQARVRDFDQAARDAAEQARVEEIRRLEAARTPPPPQRAVAEVQATADDELNCTRRFARSNPVTMGNAQNTINPIKQEYGFRKWRKFAPAFHSQTPEDFHRRLTFLSQLMYTGKAFSEATARNSVFGRAPFAVMRIGDFYHTKLVIKNIGFDFADTLFDLNPEGMGVQPMTCTVTMDGSIIGGQSLKGPIERIQNAVSFNYFANSTYYKTGMYANAVESEAVQAEIDKNRRDRIDQNLDYDINGI